MVDNLKLAKNLFSMVEGALFFGDRLRAGEMPVLMQPGIFLSSNLSQNDPDDMYVQADLSNECLDASFLYKPNAFTISQLYSDILEFSALPRKQLTQPELDEIDDLRTWLGDNYSIYATYQRRFEDAEDALNSELNSQDPDPAKIARLRRKRIDADRDWKIFGKKQEYEQKQARLIYIFRGNPTQLFQTFSDEFALYERFSTTGDRYFQTFLQPPPSEWSSPTTSWATFEKTVSETDEYSYSKATNWSGRVSAGWGLFSGSAGASGSKKFTHETSSTQHVNVRFDYLRVRVLRPWMVPDIFGYKFWSWKKSINYRILSDGGNVLIDPPIPPKGEMPVLSRNFILARNVRLTANWSESDRRYLSESLQSKASAGWGPFSVSGSYSESKQEKKVAASFDGVTISIDQPQIIGATGLLLTSLVPNPDPTLEWGDDAHKPWEGSGIDALEELARAYEPGKTDFVG